MTSRDRHRRAQLVRCIMQKTFLALEQRRALRRLTLDDAERFLPPARVPHHREKHRRHQRHLEQLAPELIADERVLQDQRAGRRHDDAEGEVRGGDAPDPEPVHEGEADPDEVERDRLPTGPQAHGDEVRARERRPRDLDRPMPQ